MAGNIADLAKRFNELQEKYAATHQAQVDRALQRIIAQTEEEIMKGKRKPIVLTKDLPPTDIRGEVVRLLNNRRIQAVFQFGQREGDWLELDW